MRRLAADTLDRIADLIERAGDRLGDPLDRWAYRAADPVYRLASRIDPNSASPWTRDGEAC